MLELKMDDCLVRGNSSDLVSVLRREGLSDTTLARLDQLVAKDLRGSGLSRVLVVVKSLETLCEQKDDLQALISHGLITKVLLWFDVIQDLLTSDLQRNAALLLSLTEEFFECFLLLGQASLPASQLSVVLLQLVRFTLKPQIHFPLRLEAIRTFNSILESVSREQKKLIQNDQNHIQIGFDMAAAVLSVGDYELQVSLSEALCRLTPRRERDHRASQWFSSRDLSRDLSQDLSQDLSRAFCDIRDADFEVDCRRFLNFVNSHHGAQRRVCTFPCVRAFLDSTELFPPKDDKLEKFWIDFNVTSSCVSFFIDEPQSFLWGTVHLQREDVDRYALQVQHGGCTGAQTLFTVWLKNPIMHLQSSGRTVELSFPSDHHRALEEAAARVFTEGLRSPPVDLTVGSVRTALPSAGPAGRSYSRRRPLSKSQLKVLPLSSPSSDEDSSAMKTPPGNLADFLFDQIRTSTPSYSSGVVVWAEPQREESAGSCDRKRAAADSGYLSGTADSLCLKKRAGPRPQREEPGSRLEGSSMNFDEVNAVITDTAAHLPLEEGPQGVEPEEGAESPEDEGSVDKVESNVEGEEPVREPEADVTGGFRAAFNTFKLQLERHLTSCCQNAEAEVLLSLQECQHHVSALLTAVHQHRRALLQQFEDGVSGHLQRLEENSSSLKVINTQILSFVQTEMRRLGTFCDKHLQRLKSLDDGELVETLPAADGGEGRS
ncbi:uncharacterized protein V6R79_009809 [Siganus canaliculatus]